MIPAKPTRIGRFFWRNFARWSIRYSFRQLEIIAPPSLDPHKSILLLGNHISWWDGFWPLEVNRRYFHRQYYVMMLESELDQRRFMRQGGAFSIAPGQRSMVQTLRYTTTLLADPRNLVLLYPQGKIHSIYDDAFHFGSVLRPILDRVKGQTQIVFFAALLDFGSWPKPSIRFYLDPYAGTEAQLNEAYQAFYARCVEQQKKQMLAT